MYSPPDLVALLAVIDTGTVRSGAAVLHKTQPAVTQAIRRLEQAVGFPLLDRSGYRVKPTEKGLAFADAARPVVNQLKQLGDFSAFLAQGGEPRIRIALDAAIPERVWLGLAGALADRFPDTAIELEALEGCQPLKRLLDEVASVAIFYDVAFDQRQGSIAQRSLGSTAFTAVIRADRGGEARVPATCPQIVVVDYEIQDLDFEIIESKRIVKVSNHQMQVAAILAGLGWGSVPHELVESGLRDGCLVPFDRVPCDKKAVQPFSMFRLKDRPACRVADFVWRESELWLSQ